MRLGRVPAFAFVALALALPVQASAARSSAAARASSFLVARPAAARLALDAAPGGAVLTRVGSRTIFGSPRVLAVVDRRDGWVAVTTEALPNGRIGWIDERTVRLASVQRSVDVDLSQRVLRVYRSGRLSRIVHVGIGRVGSTTPPGRYAITDKLSRPAYSRVYGCCILALSGHQPRPPAGWNRHTDWRLAIHGGGGIGSAVSAGCLHATDSDLRALMRMLPLGTPVFVHT